MNLKPRWLRRLEKLLRMRLPVTRIDALHQRLEVVLQPDGGEELLAEVFSKQEGLTGWAATERFVICMHGPRNLSATEERLLKRLQRLLMRIEHELPDPLPEHGVGPLPDDLPGEAGNDTLLTVPGTCNLNCLFCRYYDQPNAQDPDHEVHRLSERLAKLADDGAPMVVWGGGDFEPTTFERFPELVARAKATGIPRQRLLTNGLRTADPEYFRALVAHGVTEIVLSIAEPDERFAEMLYGKPGIFAAKRATLANCAELGVDCHTQLLLMRANYQRFGEIIAAYAPVNPRGVFILQMLTHTFTRKGTADKAEWFVPPASGVLQVVAKTATQWPALRFVFNNMPNCIVAAQARPPINVQFRPDPPSELTVARCRECDQQDSCCGFVDSRYLELYGESELNGAVIHEPTDIEALSRRMRRESSSLLGFWRKPRST